MPTFRGDARGKNFRRLLSREVAHPWRFARRATARHTDLAAA
jgi:hypothetical protein